MNREPTETELKIGILLIAFAVLAALQEPIRALQSADVLGLIKDYQTLVAAVVALAAVGLTYRFNRRLENERRAHRALSLASAVVIELREGLAWLYQTSISIEFRFKHLKQAPFDATETYKLLISVASNHPQDRPENLYFERFGEQLTVLPDKLFERAFISYQAVTRVQNSIPKEYEEISTFEKFMDIDDLQKLKDFTANVIKTLSIISNYNESYRALCEDHGIEPTEFIILPKVSESWNEIHEMLQALESEDATE